MSYVKVVWSMSLCPMLDPVTLVSDLRLHAKMVNVIFNHYHHYQYEMNLNLFHGEILLHHLSHLLVGDPSSYFQ